MNALPNEIRDSAMVLSTTVVYDSFPFVQHPSGNTISFDVRSLYLYPYLFAGMTFFRGSLTR